jgi:hypothetical protein
VFALLKARRWASSLVAGESGSSLSCASFFYCRVELTEEGLKHVPEIGEIVFRWVGGGSPLHDYCQDDCYITMLCHSRGWEDCVQVG